MKMKGGVQRGLVLRYFKTTTKINAMPPKENRAVATVYVHVHKNLVKLGWFLRYASEQTDKQPNKGHTDMFIIIHHPPPPLGDKITASLLTKVMLKAF